MREGEEDRAGSSGRTVEVKMSCGPQGQQRWRTGTHRHRGQSRAEGITEGTMAKDRREASKPCVRVFIWSKGRKLFIEIQYSFSSAAVIVKIWNKNLDH